MSDSKKFYLFLFIAGVILLAVSFAYDIVFVKSLYYHTVTTISKPIVWIPAVLCAFVFLKSGSYWLLMVVCAFADAFAYSYLGGRVVLSFQQLGMTAFAFLLIVYFLNFAKSLIKD